MRLLLIRHGQTPANVLGALDTAAPGPGLTDLGRAQAAAIPDALADERIDAIYASQLVRTQQTAAPLARTRDEMHRIVLPGIHEVTAGSIEGNTDKESIKIYLTTVWAWAGGDLDVRMPDGEDGHEFFARFDADIERIVAEQAPDATVALFSHGAAIRTWTAARATGLPTGDPKEHHLDNTAMVALEGSPSDGWVVSSWNGDPLGGAALKDTKADDVTGESLDDAIA
jgi:broad specificity phosphatase PhoE